MIVAVVAMATAGFFLWQRDLDKAFVIAAAGAVAWFLSYRVQMKEIAAAADLEDENKGYKEDAYEELDEN
jgi:hypothetical protein